MTGLTRPAGVTAALLLGLCLAGPVHAQQPISSPLEEWSSEPVDCGGFVATLTRSLSGTILEFVNAAGETTRVQAAAQMRGSLTGNGSEVALAGNLLVVIDLVRGTFAYNGAVFLATDPGSGIRIQDTGRFLTSFEDELLLEAGPHDAIDQGAAAFCDALA